MSDIVLQDLVVRMATDAGFAERVRTAPEETLGAFDLTPGEITQLTSLGADAGPGSEGLAARQSKSSLLFMGVHHPADHGALGHTGLHNPGTHISLHDPGNSLHGAQAHGTVGPQSHMDGDGATIMVTDTHEGGGGRHDLFQGTGGHSNSMDGHDDVPIMIGTIHPSGENTELPGSGPVE